MSTLNYKVSQALYRLSDWLEELALDVSGMREGFEAATKETPEEARLSAWKRQQFITGLLKRNTYPCPECEGKQLVERGTGFITCPECKGTGVDRLVASNGR